MTVDMPKINAVAEGIDTNELKRIPGAGDYTVKLGGIEQTTSKRGNQMAKITFEIDSGEFAGCWVRKYIAIQDAAKDLLTESWKYALLVCLANKAYAIPESKINDDSVDDGYDLLSNCIRLLQKYVGKTPVVPIKLHRVESGTDNEGNPIWKDTYRISE